MVSNATQHPPPHPLPATHCLYSVQYTVLWLWEEGRDGGGKQERRLEGYSSQSLIENTNVTDCISSL
jgi:hypothetical protein